MDPLAIVSLTGNLVQFVELTSKLLAEARTVYQSGAGNTARVDALSSRIKDLQAVAARTVPPSTADTGSSDEIALLNLSRKTNHLFQEITELTDKLQRKNPKSRFHAMVVTLKSQIKEGEIRRLEQGVSQCRADIVERWTMMTSDKQLSTLSELKQSVDGLNETNNTGARLVDGAKRALDEAVRSFRQQISRDGDNLVAVMESIERISKTTKETRNIDIVLSRLRYSEIHLRELSIADANQDTFRWLLYRQNDKCKGTPVDHLEEDKQPRTYDSKDSASISLSSSEVDATTEEEKDTESIPLEGPQTIHEEYSYSICEEVRAQEKDRTRIRKSFLRWLRSENGLFYIAGKPGSGKSTLMKFICSDDRTRGALTQWASSQELIFARYFFWAAGSEKQRSVEGLYRAILWETLRECPNLIEELFPQYWQSLASNKSGRLDEDGFTLQELRDAFLRLVENDKISQGHKICVFLDGLDEHSGNHWEIAKQLAQWSRNPNIKICVSCRPYNEFEHHFGQNHAHKLCLHQLTRADMISYIRDEFSKDERFVALKDQPGYRSLERELIKGAQGVFLWLRLAIDNLLEGLGSGYSVSQLRTRLAMVPLEVEDIYKKLLESIPSHDRRLASITLLAVLELENQCWWISARSDIIFSLLDDLIENDKVDPFSTESRTKLTDEEMMRRCETIIKRINKRCRGLIQIRAGAVRFSKKIGWFAASKIIEPFHRTVLDYLRIPEVVTRLQKDAPYFNARLSVLLCHIHLIGMMIPGARYQSKEPRVMEDNKIDGRGFAIRADSISSQILRAAGNLGNSSEYVACIVALGQALRLHSVALAWFSGPEAHFLRIISRPWKRAFSFELFQRPVNMFETSYTSWLHQFVTDHQIELILRETEYNTTTATSKLPLACCTIMPPQIFPRDEAQGGLRILKVLLTYGLDPNGKIPMKTVYARFRCAYTEYGELWTIWTACLFMEVPYITAERPLEHVVEMAKVFLSNGADPAIALVGYLKDDGNISTSGYSKPLPDDASYSGPFYIDLTQLLRIWESAGVPIIAILSKEHGDSYSTSWFRKIIRLTQPRSAESKGRIRRLEAAELGSKALIVLTVVPLGRLADILVEELENTLQKLRSDGDMHFLFNL